MDPNARNNTHWPVATSLGPRLLVAALALCLLVACGPTGAPPVAREADEYLGGASGTPVQLEYLFPGATESSQITAELMDG